MSHVGKNGVTLTRRELAKKIKAVYVDERLGDKFENLASFVIVHMEAAYNRGLKDGKRGVRSVTFDMRRMKVTIKNDQGE